MLIGSISWFISLTSCMMTNLKIFFLSISLLSFKWKYFKCNSIKNRSIVVREKCHFEWRVTMRLVENICSLSCCHSKQKICLWYSFLCAWCIYFEILVSFWTDINIEWLIYKLKLLWWEILLGKIFERFSEIAQRFF